MHTHYPKGTPLFIKMRDGTVIEGKFHDHKSGCVILADSRKIKLSEVRAMSPRKLRIIDLEL